MIPIDAVLHYLAFSPINVYSPNCPLEVNGAYDSDSISDNMKHVAWLQLG